MRSARNTPKRDCEPTNRGAKSPRDFKKSSERSRENDRGEKFFQKPMSSQEKVREQNRDMVEKAQKDLGTTTVEVLPDEKTLVVQDF